MDKIYIKVDKKTGMVYLENAVIGRDKENLQQELIFSFENGFILGSPRLEYKIGNNRYHIPMERIDETYVVPIKNILTVEGKIEMQLVIVEQEQDEEIPVFKSNVFYVYCNKSINAQEEAPDDYEYWLDVIQEKIVEMDNIDIDIQTVDDNTEVIITRKDGTTKEAIVSGGGGVADVKVNNTSVVSDGIANIDLTGYVQDSNYVHTDNNYTTNEKNKLAGLSNYDDTEVRGLINDVADNIPTKTSDLTNDSGFITGYTETDPTVPSHVKNITQANITNWNNKLDSSKVKNTNSTTVGDVYDVRYINNMIGDVESLLGGI